jgi:hypothetical protein
MLVGSFFHITIALTWDKRREVLLVGTYAAPEVAFWAQPLAQQDHAPDLYVATSVPVPGDEEGQQERRQREQQP